MQSVIVIQESLNIRNHQPAAGFFPHSASMTLQSTCTITCTSSYLMNTRLLGSSGGSKHNLVACKLEESSEAVVPDIAIRSAPPRQAAAPCAAQQGGGSTGWPAMPQGHIGSHCTGTAWGTAGPAASAPRASRQPAASWLAGLGSMHLVRAGLLDLSQVDA